MLVFNVTFKCKSGMREKFLESIRAEGIDAASRAEAGNLAYDFYLSVGNCDDLFLVDKYKDDGAVMAHVKQPHVAKLVELRNEYVADVVMEKYEAE